MHNNVLTYKTQNDLQFGTERVVKIYNIPEKAKTTKILSRDQNCQVAHIYQIQTRSKKCKMIESTIINCVDRTISFDFVPDKNNNYYILKVRSLFQVF
jgi:hypothetical protein